MILGRVLGLAYNARVHLCTLDIPVKLSLEFDAYNEKTKQLLYYRCFVYFSIPEVRMKTRIPRQSTNASTDYPDSLGTVF